MRTVISQSVDDALMKLPIGGPVVGDLLKQVRQVVQKELGDNLWRWFHEHEDDVLYAVKKKIWKFSFSVPIRVKDARFIFEQLAGPEPDAVVA